MAYFLVKFLKIYPDIYQNFTKKTLYEQRGIDLTKNQELYSRVVEDIVEHFKPIPKHKFILPANFVFLVKIYSKNNSVSLDKALFFVAIFPQESFVGWEYKFMFWYMQKGIKDDVNNRLFWNIYQKEKLETILGASRDRQNLR